MVSSQSRSKFIKNATVLAGFGIVLAPITSGDTAFRSTRKLVSDVFKNNQKEVRK